MFGIGITEIVLILIVALVIVGPEKLPELVKSVAKGFNEFKRTTNDLKRRIDWSSESPSRRSSTSSYEEAGEPTEEKATPEKATPEKAARKKPAVKKKRTKKATPEKATPEKATPEKVAKKKKKEGVS